jgi:hypothetical protein
MRKGNISILEINRNAEIAQDIVSDESADSDS